METQKAAAKKSQRTRNQTTFRIGRVRGDLRGRVWYLTYFEQGIRRRPRVGHDRTAAENLAAQINALAGLESLEERIVLNGAPVFGDPEDAPHQLVLYLSEDTAVDSTWGPFLATDPDDDAIQYNSYTAHGDEGVFAWDSSGIVTLLSPLDYDNGVRITA